MTKTKKRNKISRNVNLLESYNIDETLLRPLDEILTAIVEELEENGIFLRSKYYHLIIRHYIRLIPGCSFKRR